MPSVKPSIAARMARTKVLPSAVIKLAPHRRRVEHRQAEVAAQRTAEPEQILQVERLVEAERGLHLGDHLGRGLGRHQQVDRVAGHDVDQAEHDQRDPEQDRDCLDDAAGGENEHPEGSRRDKAMLHRSIMPNLTADGAICPAQIQPNLWAFAFLPDRTLKCCVAAWQSSQQSEVNMHNTAIHPDVVSRANQRRGGLRVFNSLNPERTAHIVVDLQNGFMAPGQVAEIATAREIVPNVNRISAALRDAGGLVVYIQNTFDEVAVATWSTFFEHFCTPGTAPADDRDVQSGCVRPCASGPASRCCRRTSRCRSAASVPSHLALPICMRVLQAARHRHADRHRHRDAGVLRVHRARRDDAELQGVLHRRRQCDVQRRRTQRDAVGNGARVLRCDRYRHDGRNDRTRRRGGRAGLIPSWNHKPPRMDNSMFTRRGFMASAAGAAAIPGLPASAASPQILRIGMTAADLPTTHGIPNNGGEGFRFLGYPAYDFDRQLGLHPHRQAGRRHTGPVHCLACRRDQPVALDLRRPAGREVPRRLGVQRRRGDLEPAADLRRQVAAIRCAGRADRTRHRVDDRQVREGRRQDHRPDNEVSVQLPALSADPHPDRQPDAVGEGRQDLGGVRQGTRPAPGRSRSPRWCSASTPR